MIRALLALILLFAVVIPEPASAQDLPGNLGLGGAREELPTRGFNKRQFLPDIELPRIDGQGTLRLSDFAAKAYNPGGEPKPGKKLLLMNFASW